jgi:hypothetical protein
MAGRDPVAGAYGRGAGRVAHPPRRRHRSCGRPRTRRTCRGVRSSRAGGHGSPPGQSGVPSDPHVFDQLPLYQRSSTSPSRWAADRVGRAPSARARV